MKTLVKLMMVLAFGLAAYSALTGKAGAHEVYDDRATPDHNLLDQLRAWSRAEHGHDLTHYGYSPRGSLDAEEVDRGTVRFTWTAEAAWGSPCSLTFYDGEARRTARGCRFLLGRDDGPDGFASLAVGKAFHAAPWPQGRFGGLAREGDYIGIVAVYDPLGRGEGAAVQVLAHVHFTEGQLGSPEDEWREVAFIPFMPGATRSGADHRLHVVHRGAAPLKVRITGFDTEGGQSAGGGFVAWLDPEQGHTLDMRRVEQSIGDGSGAWTLLVEAYGEGRVSVVPLMRSGDGWAVLPLD